MSNYLALLCAASGLFSFGQAGVQAKQGEPAPEFKLMDQTGKAHSLADYRGRWVVLYFYPRDDTPGCRAEACAFRDEQAQLDDLDIVLLGVSTDGLASHQKFVDKYRLAFPLLSDIDGEVARAYGSLFRLGPIKFARRHSFIVDPDGRVARVYRAVNPRRHGDEVVMELQGLMQVGPWSG